MAAMTERNGRWRALVHIKPFPPKAKTFGTPAEAASWADDLEADLRNRRQAEIISRKPKPTTWYEIRHLPRLKAETSAVGIYFLFRDDECIYVGQSRQVHTRVREHRMRGSETNSFTTYAWVSCELDELNSLEKAYIDLLQPPLNIMLTASARERFYSRRKKPERQKYDAAL